MQMCAMHTPTHLGYPTCLQVHGSWPLHACIASGHTPDLCCSCTSAWAHHQPVPSSYIWTASPHNPVRLPQNLVKRSIYKHLIKKQNKKQLHPLPSSSLVGPFSTMCQFFSSNLRSTLGACAFQKLQGRGLSRPMATPWEEEGGEGGSE